MVYKYWRHVLKCWGLWLCDSSDEIGSHKLNMARMWPGVTKKLLKLKKPKNILFHSKLFLSTFWWKGKFLDITSAELLLLRLIWYRFFNLCLMTGNNSKLVWQGVSNIFTMLNDFTHLKNFKHFGSSTCSYSIPWYMWPTQSGDWIWTCEHGVDPKCLKFVRYSCSCSELRNVAVKYKLLSPQYSYMGV